MFTGLVEILAPIKAIAKQDVSKSGGGGYSMTIGDCAHVLGDCHIGDSIAVNGTCLTVTEFDPSAHGGYFKIGVAPETLKKTNLGDLKEGEKVNLERAMAADTRFGGHFVQGHVDTTAVIRSVVPTGNALTLTLRLSHQPGVLPLPSELSPYLIPKGYITLDGASLTLIDVSPATGGRLEGQHTIGETTEDAAGASARAEVVEFSVMLIAHTQEMIGLSSKKPGAKVNVEFDMVGKYVHRAVVGAAGSQPEEYSLHGVATVDAGGQSVDAGTVHVAVQGASQRAAAGDALERMVERVVRRVLAEGGAGK